MQLGEKNSHCRYFARRKSQFLCLFGFGIDGVDYAQDVDPRVVT